MARHHLFGKKGEGIAKRYLLNKGYRIRHQNWTCHWGEIDFVAQKKGRIVFIEVKTRRYNVLESFSRVKRRHLLRSIQFYIKRYGLAFSDMQIDFLGIETDGISTEVIHIENAVEARI